MAIYVVENIPGHLLCQEYTKRDMTSRHWKANVQLGERKYIRHRKLNLAQLNQCTLLKPIFFLTVHFNITL